MAIFRLAVVEQILLAEDGAIRALIPLLVASVSVFIGLAGLFRCVPIVNLLSKSQSRVLL